MNPQHTIPTIKDGSFALWESRAIMCYLANKYGKDDTLYPKDPVARARVDQKLYFDMGTLYQRFADYYYPQVFMKAPADPEKFKKIEEAFGFFNTALEGQKYAAGDNITLADLALVASVSTFDVMKFPIDNYPNVARWYKDCQASVVGYDVNVAGMEAFRHLVEAMK